MKKPDLESIANRLKIRQQASGFTDPNVKEFADQAVEALDEADAVYGALMADPDRPVTCGELAQVLATVRQLLVAVPAVQNQMIFSMTLDHLNTIESLLANLVAEQPSGEQQL